MSSGHSHGARREERSPRRQQHQRHYSRSPRRRRRSSRSVSPSRESVPHRDRRFARRDSIDIDKEVAQRRRDESSSDDSEAKREEKRRLQKEKEMIKSTETPEERRQRRIAKKEAKQKRADSSQFGYTDESNPFGDQQLSKPFVWSKKYKGVAKEKIEKQLKRRQGDKLEEITAIKKRREDRELEKEQMEELKVMMQRQQEMDMNADWDRKEEEFHKEQVRVRVAKRITENRGRPSDLLAQNLFIIEFGERKNRPKGHGDDINYNDQSFDLFEPISVFHGLEVNELEKLLEDIEGHIDMGDHLDYWNALKVVCEDKLSSISKDSVIHAVRNDIKFMMEKKTCRELRDLQISALRKVSGLDEDSGVAIDVDYWQSLIPVMDVAIAKAFLKEFHVDLLRQRLMHLTRENIRPIPSLQPDEFLFPSSSKVRESAAVQFHAGSSSTKTELHPSFDMSPRVVPFDSFDHEVFNAILPQDDLSILIEDRRRVISQQLAKFQENKGRVVPQAKPKAVLDEIDTSMNEDEEQFSDLFNLPEQEHLSQDWAEKYKPRKPRFFNRVKTGYEWSKYNQMYYDRDNPPPKVVQGYKFNLFYPDLLDTSVAPTFNKMKIPDDPEHCILRFVAGPPYQDIAFRIVDKPWESSGRHGFKCKFEKGILHLYFNFRRIRYRR